MITFQEALAVINKEIQRIDYPHDASGLYKPVAYLLSLKGKKIRPALTLLACNLYREEVDEAISPALAWEIFHNFTLMHDDVMDKADIRRGQPTVHKQWNENTAILSGDAMLILAYSYMAKSPQSKLKLLLDLFSDTAASICSGQQYDMDFEKRMDVTESEYINMIYLKTAIMMGACLQTGAIIGDAGASDRQNLYDFGIHLGIAFQIEDDILDVYGDPEAFGKKIGGDILCNKKTYLLIKALDIAKGDDKKELLHWIKNDVQSDSKIKAVRDLYDKLAVKEEAYAIIAAYCKQAEIALQAVAVDEEKKEILMNFARNLKDRKY
ncbi:MAG: polyprenyl synthetase family protein [Dysgonamonadaceae bacterium]|jgi:geranylgeranyl diphosphate synthase type II|nr:polyprenyl synthetase family protein [Dysgonamonadaceae bacterium]